MLEICSPNASKILEITAKSSDKARFLPNWLPKVDFIEHNLQLSNKENHPMLKRSVSSYVTSFYERSQENRAIVWKVAKSKRHYQRQFLPAIVSQRGAYTLYPLDTSTIQKADKSSGPHLADAYNTRQTMQLLKEARIHVVGRDENSLMRPHCSPPNVQWVQWSRDSI